MSRALGKELHAGPNEAPGYHIPSPVARIANELQHRWLFCRRYDYSGRDFEIRELKHTNRPATPLEWGEIAANPSLDQSGVWREGLDPRLEQIFQCFWPAEAKGSFWQHDWHSFELIM